MKDMIKLIKLVRSIGENLPLLTYPTMDTIVLKETTNIGFPV